MSNRARSQRSLLRLVVAAGLTGAAAVVVASGAEPAAVPAMGEGAANGTHQAIVASVTGVEIPVSDLERAVGFYTQVLGFTKVGELEEAGAAVERLHGVFGVRRVVASLRLGNEEIALVQYLAPEGRPIPVDSRSNDGWFQHIAIVVRDLDAAYKHLRAHKVRHASSGPQVLPLSNPNAGGIGAFYFKDPDGHVLEVIHFPPGKGDPRWQAKSERLFLGIDHTAIAVRDTESSLRFYRDELGMRVAGNSENLGDEQEHLNNVFGARLRITALRADSGPGVELLEYLAPRDGRAYPGDTKASDLWAWQTRVEVYNARTLDAAESLTRGSWVSPGIVADERRGLQVADPDGHRIQLLEPAPGSRGK